MDYREKYLKYKAKYLDLKAKLDGGKNPVDICKKFPIIRGKKDPPEKKICTDYINCKIDKKKCVTKPCNEHTQDQCNNNSNCGLNIYNQCLPVNDLCSKYNKDGLCNNYEYTKGKCSLHKSTRCIPTKNCSGKEKQDCYGDCIHLRRSGCVVDPYVETKRRDWSWGGDDY